MDIVKKRRYQMASTDESLDIIVRGTEILNEPLLNKGAAFTLEERDTLGLRGLVPPKVGTLEEQVERVLENFRSKIDPMEKYIFLAALHDRNETLYYKVLTENMREMTPIVYTPVVGKACQQFGHIYRKNRGMYISIQDRGHIREMFDNWNQEEVDIIVVSDGSRILGLGDLGANGMGIPIGKLALYVAGGGIFPCKTLPILLDAGTNNEMLLNDPLYLGVNKRRVKDEKYYALVDEFVNAAVDRWPKVLIQWEDFTNNHSFALLEKYRDKVPSFNDDIQGTGAMVLAGLFGALRVKDEQLIDQRVVFFGAGSAATGIAQKVLAGMMIEGKLSEKEALKRFWIYDYFGLVTEAQKKRVPKPMALFARKEKEIATFLELIKKVKPTVLIGVSGQGRAFNEIIIKEMHKYTKQPIIFSLSNPTKNSECTAEQAYTWTNGDAIFASGSPYDPVRLNGKIYTPGQGNNMFIFPGVGLGAKLCGAKHITESMFIAAARTLALMVNDYELSLGAIYPDLGKIRQISTAIAAAVCRVAYDEDEATVPEPDDIMDYVRENMYHPYYPKYVAVTE